MKSNIIMLPTGELAYRDEYIANAQRHIIGVQKYCDECPCSAAGGCNTCDTPDELARLRKRVETIK